MTSAWFSLEIGKIVAMIFKDFSVVVGISFFLLINNQITRKCYSPISI